MLVESTLFLLVIKCLQIDLLLYVFISAYVLYQTKRYFTVSHIMFYADDEHERNVVV